MNGSLAVILALIALPASSFAASYASCAWYRSHAEHRSFNEHGSITPRCDENHEAAMDDWTCADWTPVDPGHRDMMHVFHAAAQSRIVRS